MARLRPGAAWLGRGSSLHAGSRRCPARATLRPTHYSCHPFLYAPLTSPCSDEALAALLCQLHRLQALSLERCSEAGDAALAALAKHVSRKPCVATMAQLARGAYWSCTFAPAAAAVAAGRGAAHQLGSAARSQLASSTVHGCCCMLQALGLRELRLAYTGVSDQGLRQLSSLGQVSGPAGCGAQDCMCDVLVGCFSTTCAHPPPDSAPRAHGAPCPKPLQLRLLSVESCGVGDRGLEVLRSLTALQSLDIRWAAYYPVFQVACLCTTQHCSGSGMIELRSLDSR